MEAVKFTYPYSGSVAKFQEMKRGDTLEVTETEKNILLNLGVIEGAQSIQQKEEAAQLELNKAKQERQEVKTKEEKHGVKTKEA